MISNWKEDYITKSLFMISIGMEDYYNFTKNNPTADGSAQQAFVISVISRLRNNIEVSTFNFKVMRKLVSSILMIFVTL